MYINGLHVLDVLPYLYITVTFNKMTKLYKLFSNRNDHWLNGINIHLIHQLPCLIKHLKYFFIVFVRNFSSL